MVGDSPDLLVPVRDIPSCGVESNEVKEYYTPERHNVIFRLVSHWRRYYSLPSFELRSLLAHASAGLADLGPNVNCSHLILCRYAVTVLADTPSTVQVSTSKSDVNFRVEVYTIHVLHPLDLIETL